MKRIDRTGEKYGRLTVLEHVPNSPGAKDTNARWLCRCDCGTTKVVYGQDLGRGKVVSCGCWNAEKRVKHGMSHTHVYDVWSLMRDRCNNPNNPSYHNYGGRGIRVCERWNSFNDFLADMGERPDGYEIDRKNNDGNYEPSNCQWISRQRNLNNKRNNRLLELNGQTHTIAEWSRITGLSWLTIRQRLRYGWTVERTLTEPVKNLKRKEQ
jgi:hypothetical protein